ISRSGMPICIACGYSHHDRRDFHQFTSRENLRDEWLAAITQDDAAKASLDSYLRNSSSRHFICTAHFSPDSYDETPHYRALKRDAVPISIRQMDPEVKMENDANEEAHPSSSDRMRGVVQQAADLLHILMRSDADPEELRIATESLGNERYSALEWETKMEDPIQNLALGLAESMESGMNWLMEREKKQQNATAVKIECDVKMESEQSEISHLIDASKAIKDEDRTIKSELKEEIEDNEFSLMVNSTSTVYNHLTENEIKKEEPSSYPGDDDSIVTVQKQAQANDPAAHIKDEVDGIANPNGQVKIEEEDWDHPVEANGAIIDTIFESKQSTASIKRKGEVIAIPAKRPRKSPINEDTEEKEGISNN
ncbi:hypothetical protein PENTCL1PPCAC_1837, partial [Pristionchus entomophagus]